MHRTIEMLCLIRSRKKSSDFWSLAIYRISRYFEYMEYWNRLEKEKKLETRRGKASSVCVD